MRTRRWIRTASLPTAPRHGLHVVWLPSPGLISPEEPGSGRPDKTRLHILYPRHLTRSAGVRRFHDTYAFLTLRAEKFDFIIVAVNQPRGTL